MFFKFDIHGESLRNFTMVDVGLEPTTQENTWSVDDAICKVIGGDTECPLQVCQLSRSSESTHFLCLRRDVALFDFTRARDSF